MSLENSSVLKASGYIVMPKGELLFSGRATTVSVDDEAAGAFIVLSTLTMGGYQKVESDFAEWPLICEAVESGMIRCSRCSQEQCATSTIKNNSILRWCGRYTAGAKRGRG